MVETNGTSAKKNCNKIKGRLQNRKKSVELFTLWAEDSHWALVTLGKLEPGHI